MLQACLFGQRRLLLRDELASSSLRRMTAKGGQGSLEAKRVTVNMRKESTMRVGAFLFMKIFILDKKWRIKRNIQQMNVRPRISYIFHRFTKMAFMHFLECSEYFIATRVLRTKNTKRSKYRYISSVHKGLAR